MINYDIDTLDLNQLRTLANNLQRLCEYYETKMINKAEVAERAGMTVSWLNNSTCPTAQKLREIGVRYGKGQTTPVRFPLRDVIAICREGES